MGTIQDIVSGVRNVRAEMHIPPEKAVSAVMHAGSEETLALVESMRANIISQARLESLDLALESQRPALSASLVGAGWEVWIPLEGMIDIVAERARLEKEKDRLSQEVARVKAKLDNQGFVARAPEEVIAAERAKLDSWEERLTRLAKGLNDLAG
jgi:valyl-tRNA synthetase